MKEMLIQAKTWLTSLEKSGLPGKYAWGYQHGVLPRLLWPLLVYEVPISTVEGHLPEEMAGHPKKLLLHWPVQHKQQAAAACNIRGRGIQDNKNMPRHDALRQSRCKSTPCKH